MIRADRNGEAVHGAIRPDQIPDEVVEAARVAWLRSDVNAKEDWRSAIAAALNAWPGAYPVDYGGDEPPFIVLPTLRDSAND